MAPCGAAACGCRSAAPAHPPSCPASSALPAAQSMVQDEGDIEIGLDELLEWEKDLEPNMRQTEESLRKWVWLR